MEILDGIPKEMYLHYDKEVYHEWYVEELQKENKTFRRLMREELERQGYTFNAEKFEATLKEEIEK